MGRTAIDCCPPECPLRRLACHGSCPRYATQRAELDQSKQLRREAWRMGRAIGAVQWHSHIKAKKAEEKRRKQKGNTHG